MDAYSRCYWKSKFYTAMQGAFLGSVLGATMVVGRRMMSGGGMRGIASEAAGGAAFMGCILGAGSVWRH